jgi:hypothetical protein
MLNLARALARGGDHARTCSGGAPNLNRFGCLQFVDLLRHRVARRLDLFDEDEYGRALLETLSLTLRRTLRSALARQTEAEFFVSHELRYRDRRPEEWARVVEILRIYAHKRRRLVGLIDGIEAEAES